MLKDLRRRVYWVAITLAGFSQAGPMGSDAAVFIVAALLNTARAIWLSLPQPRRERHHHELPSRRAGIRRERRKAALWRRPSAGLKTARSRARLPNSQEHHHAYS